MSDVIKQILKEDAKNSNELLKKTQEFWLKTHDSFPKSTFYRHLEKLSRLGEIEKTKIIKYELPEKEKEADPKEVHQYIDVIKKEQNERVLEISSESFCKLFNKRRGAHIAGVLSFIEQTFENTKYANPNILKHFLHALYNLLFFEKRRRATIDTSIVTRMNGNSNKIRNICLESFNNEVIVLTLIYLKIIRNR